MPDAFSLDLHTLRHRKAQDLVLKTVYHWIRHNAEPEYPTISIHDSPFLHAYYKVFFQIFLMMALTSSVYTQKTSPFLTHNQILLHP